MVCSQHYSACCWNYPDIQYAVNRGAEILSETAETLEHVVAGTDEVSGFVIHMADAANREAAALNQVSEGIEQISRVVQTNSATAEEFAASSQELAGQASRLNELIGRFKLYRGKLG